MSDGKEVPPVCPICGTVKARGTWTVGQKVTVFWMCPALAHVHRDIEAMGGPSSVEDDIVWDDNDLAWEDV